MCGGRLIECEPAIYAHLDLGCDDPVPPVRFIDAVRAAIVMWPTYGLQDWRCPIDRAAMVRDWKLK
jgi:hypothetical protein